MAQAALISDVYPYRSIRFSIGPHESGEVFALLDTGFDGSLLIPKSFPNRNLGLPESDSEWELADGSIAQAPVYVGIVQIMGLPPFVAPMTVMGNQHSIGRRILDRFSVTFDRGQRVILEP